MALATAGLFLLTTLTKSGPNVLFVVVDDLAPTLSSYGSAQVISPK